MPTTLAYVLDSLFFDIKSVSHLSFHLLRLFHCSVKVFGVSAESMQCSHDSRGNSVPTILLTMQRHLYSKGGLKVVPFTHISADCWGFYFLEYACNKFFNLCYSRQKGSSELMQKIDKKCWPENN